MKAAFKTLLHHLEEGRPVVSATIISQKGSTPRTAGTKMIVEENGRFTGTIGGGLLEARVLTASADVFRQKKSRLMKFDLTKDDVASMDMICGGVLDVLIEYIPPTDECRDVFRRMGESLDQNQPGLLVTVISDPLTDILAHGFVARDGARTGILADHPMPDEVADRIGAIRYPVIIDENGTTCLVEPAVLPSRAFLFGAGHVAQPTSDLASVVGFHVTVLDDRIEFANQDRFPHADRVIVLNGFENAFPDQCIDPDSYIVILTRGHLHDRTVLAQALKTDAGYIGMIGSRRKRNAIYHALLEEGFTQSDIDRVHSPIGVSIEAETPEEIAVSIVAELIQVRARRRKT
jgi:xanthine dehydrogenase accessory factor